VRYAHTPMCTFVRMSPAGAETRPARRHDRIVEVTIGVIAEHGVAGTTHRLTAVAAAEQGWAVAYERHRAALRDPALRTVTESWMRRSRGVLERFADPVTARGVDALIEGRVMHQMLSSAPVSRPQARQIVARVLDAG
jgi:DNA-binding transcriptional regulator YbjK